MSTPPLPPTTSDPPENMWSRIVSGEAKKGEEAKEESEAKGDDKPMLDGTVWPELTPGSLISGIDEGYH